jgi:hypothetical protein
MKKELGLSATEKGAKGNTDWQKLRALPDPEVIFTEDAPATSPETGPTRSLIQDYRFRRTRLRSHFALMMMFWRGSRLKVPGIRPA